MFVGGLDFEGDLRAGVRNRQREEQLTARDHKRTEAGPTSTKG